MTDALARERARARYFGFASLLVWASLGVALESAHAFKLSAYLDHPLRRELLLWSHAHGVGLSLVVLVYASQGVHHARALWAGWLLRAAAVLMPLGFALSVLGHAEGDPGPAIFLVPVGALLLLAGLVQVLRNLPRS